MGSGAVVVVGMMIRPPVVLTRGSTGPVAPDAPRVIGCGPVAPENPEVVFAFVVVLIRVAVEAVIGIGPEAPEAPLKSSRATVVVVVKVLRAVVVVGCVAIDDGMMTPVGRVHTASVPLGVHMVHTNGWAQ